MNNQTVQKTSLMASWQYQHVGVFDVASSRTKCSDNPWMASWHVFLFHMSTAFLLLLFLIQLKVTFSHLWLSKEKLSSCHIVLTSGLLSSSSQVFSPPCPPSLTPCWFVDPLGTELPACWHSVCYCTTSVYMCVYMKVITTLLDDNKIEGCMLVLLY